MGNSFCFEWEVSVIQWMQSAESPVVNFIAECASLFGEEYFLILVVGLCYWCIDKRLGRNVSLAVSGSILFGCLFQGIIQRRRPYFDHQDIKCIREAHPGEDIMSVTAQGYSMPSLHSTLTVGGYGTLALNVKNKVVTCITVMLPLIVGISRLYLGVHYPTDILCGWFLGAVVMLMFWYIEGKYGYKAGLVIQLVIGAAGFMYCRDNGFYTIYGVTAGLLLGFWYEEKHVGFEMSTRWPATVLRTVSGVALFVIISSLLKIPVRNLSTDEHMAFRLAYRSFRYGFSTFVIMGLYPHLFKSIRFFR